MTDAPNITEISGSREVNESDVLRLKCTADGDPTPNITWTKVSDNSTVFFPLTITGKQNEGLYRCTAQNGVGRPESSEVNITVESNYWKRELELKRRDFWEPPVMLPLSQIIHDLKNIEW